MDFASGNPLPSFEQRALEKFFNEERESMAAEGYAVSKEATLREVALNVILKNSKCFNFDAFIPYLAMNYFDRFISRNRLPNVLGRVRDDIVLAAICCLTLAWKVRNQAFRFIYFERENNLNEDYKRHILNMELQILKGLEWRLRAVTAMYFKEFFAEKTPVGKGIKRRTVNEIIIQAQGDINFTQYKPSVVAASSLLTACRLLYPNEYNQCEREILATKYIKELWARQRVMQPNRLKSFVSMLSQEELESCLKRTYEMCMEKHILLERNAKLKLDPRRKVEAGETSSSMLSKDPLQDILHRPGKAPIQEISELVSEKGTDPSLFSRRLGKERMLEIPEIGMEPDESDNETGLSFELKWRLWSSDNPEDDISIDSPLFRPLVPVLDPNDGTDQAQAGPNSTSFVQRINCTLM